MYFKNELIDLRQLTWTKTRESSGTAGSYLKSYSYENGKKKYYKLSYFDDISKKFGYESFNEIIACILLDIFEFEHLNYFLSEALIKINNKEYKTYLTYSYDFKGINESKISFENFYELNKLDNEDIISFSKRYNFINSIYNMIIIDYLIINRDRHGANIEVLYNNKNKTYHLAPLFDHGLSLLSPYYKDDDILNFDDSSITRVNSYIGTSSLEENLKIVPKDYIKMKKIDINSIFNVLEPILDKNYLAKVKNIIAKRWCYLEDFFNKK